MRGEYDTTGGDGPAPCLDVLDHGLVRFVDHMGSDLSIVRAARVSYAADWRAGEDEGSDARLIRYLWRNRHTTPFEACYTTWEIACPIFVARQWHRHRTQSYNEVSARYTRLPDVFYVPEVGEIGLQSKHNKQMRDRVENPHAEAIRDIIADHGATAFAEYARLLDLGCPRELARCVLPTGTYTRFFASLNLLNLFRFLELRLGDHVQHEIRVYAEAMLELARPAFPTAVAAFEETRA